MITVTELRSDLYNKIDHVIATGLPLEIERKGHIVKIVSVDSKVMTDVTTAPNRPSKFSRLVSRDNVINGDPADIVHINWSDYGVF
jgi:hypothetical protein